MARGDPRPRASGEPLDNGFGRKTRGNGRGAMPGRSLGRRFDGGHRGRETACACSWPGDPSRAGNAIPARAQTPPHPVT